MCVLRVWGMLYCMVPPLRCVTEQLHVAGGLRDEHCAWRPHAEHWCDLSLLSLEEPSSIRLGWLVGFVSFEISGSLACGVVFCMVVGCPLDQFLSINVSQLVSTN